MGNVSAGASVSHRRRTDADCIPHRLLHTAGHAWLVLQCGRTRHPAALHVRRMPGICVEKQQLLPPTRVVLEQHRLRCSDPGLRCCCVFSRKLSVCFRFLVLCLIRLFCLLSSPLTSSPPCRWVYRCHSCVRSGCRAACLWSVCNVHHTVCLALYRRSSCSVSY